MLDAGWRPLGGVAAPGDLNRVESVSALLEHLHNIRQMKRWACVVELLMEHGVPRSLFFPWRFVSLFGLSFLIVFLSIVLLSLLFFPRVHG